MIIDDHRLFADGLSLVLSQTGKYTVSTFYNARSVLDDKELLKEHDLALIDLDMPSLDGFGFLQGVITRKLPLKVVVVSGVESRADISRLLHLGAKGFFPKNSPSPVMLEGVEAVLAGQVYVPKHILLEIDWPIVLTSQNDKASYETTAAKQALDTISPRQLEVLGLLKEGQSNKEIAQILEISESTVKSHIKILFQALGVKNRTACAQKGIDYELV